MKKAHYLIVLTLLFSACQSKKNESATLDTNKSQTTDTTLITAIDTSQAQQKAPLEKYTGTIPCADCSGIKMELTIDVDNIYQLKETYLGKGDEKPIESIGKINTERGFEKDIDATLYILNYDKPGKERYFVRLTDQPGLIHMLGLDKKLIQSKLNYTLRKID